ALAALYLAPVVVARWRQVENQAAADAVYLKRQAELKAEADAAGKSLETLDRRVRLVAHGFRDVARKMAPVVVNITNEVEAPPKARGRLFYDFDTERTYLERSEGSGVIARPGHVLTNYHVVRNAGRLRVTFASGRWLTVEPDAVLKDPDTDLAV